MANLNKKQLLFINKYFEYNLNATKAYKAVYNCKTDASARAASSLLLTNVNVIKEINIRKEELKKKSEITKEEIIRDLKIIKDSNICDFINIVKKTKIENKINFETGEMEEEEVEYTELEYKDTAELTTEQQKMIKSIEMTKFGPKIILHDKQNAIDTLNKMLGYYDENVNLNTTIDTSSIKNLSFEELEKLVNVDE